MDEESTDKNSNIETDTEVEKTSSLRGSGAMADNHSTALGERAVYVGGNSGTVVTGQILQIINHYAPPDESNQKQVISDSVVEYLRWLRERSENIEIRGIRLVTGTRIALLPIKAAYVTLQAVRHVRFTEAYDTPPADRTASSDLNLKRIFAAGKRIIITGGAGSGKTTILLHAAWTLANALLDESSELPWDTPDLERDRPLPVFVPLASFAHYRRLLPASANAGEKTLAHFISHHLISKQAAFNLPVDFFVRLLKDGCNVALLLDGLDEIPDDQDRSEVREAIEDLARGRDSLRIITTCRTVAYQQGRTALGAEFSEFTVAPLTFDQIQTMVILAYQSIFPKKHELSNARAADLTSGIKALEENRRIRLGKTAEPLITSPLMVRLMLIVHINERRLPDERADLFEKAVCALLSVDYGREENDIRALSKEWEIYREITQFVAYHMHDLGDIQGWEIDEHTLRRMLKRNAEFNPYVEEFISNTRARGGLFEERDGQYRFIHLAFQEFLAARYLSEVIGAEDYAAITTAIPYRLDDVWWREPILLLINFIALRSVRAGHEFIEKLRLSGDSSIQHLNAAELAAISVAEWPDSNPTLRANCATQIAHWLREDAFLVLSPAHRARFATPLSRLGDTRFKKTLHFLPDDTNCGFVFINSKNNFQIGTARSRVSIIENSIGIRLGNEEINDSITPSKPFWIARFPVTVAQYRAFVEATRYPNSHPRSLQDLASQPVRWVSYADCLAYCRWLTREVSMSDAFKGFPATALIKDQKWIVALPTELQWEAASKSANDFANVTGTEAILHHANCADSMIGGPSIVGCFAENSWGLNDMLGNVWEWTRSRWGPNRRTPSQQYPSLDDDSSTVEIAHSDQIMRVVRGGSWTDPAGICRAEYRGRRKKEHQSANLGFRLALSKVVDSSDMPESDSHDHEG